MTTRSATHRPAAVRRTRAGCTRLDRLASRIMIALVAFTVLVVVAGALCAPEPPAPSGWTRIEVPGNGTLWDIASTHTVPGLSTSATIDLIQAENRLTSSTLHAGQTLVVPAISETSVAVAQR